MWGGEWGVGWGGGFILWCCPCAPSRPFAQCCNLSVVTVNRCGPMLGCRATSACAFLSGTGVRGVGAGGTAAQTAPLSTHG